MNEIEIKCLEIANECAKQLNMNIVSVEYVLEQGMKILRVICESYDGLSIDEVTNLNELISLKLDEIDLIDEQYYLEVASEGIEKELKNDDDILKSIGKYVYVKTKEKIGKRKEFYGDLISFHDDVIKLSCNVKNKVEEVEILKEKIDLIRLAVKF